MTFDVNYNTRDDYDEAIKVEGEFDYSPLSHWAYREQWSPPEVLHACSVWEFNSSTLSLDGAISLLVCGEGGGVAIGMEEPLFRAALRMIAWRPLRDAARSGGVKLYAKGERLSPELFAHMDYVLSPGRWNAIEPNPDWLDDDELAALFEPGADRRRITGVGVDQRSLAEWVGRKVTYVSAPVINASPWTRFPRNAWEARAFNMPVAASTRTNGGDE